MFESSDPQSVPAALRWKRMSLLPGTSVHGWIAGRFVGVQTHWLGKSSPCRKELTKGKLKCVCETNSYDTRWTGYLPLLDRSYRQVVVTIGTDTREALKLIPVGNAVKCSKAKYGNAPVMVTMDEYTSPSERVTDGVGSDIKEWLLTLWGDDELASWIMENPVTVKKAVDLDEATLPARRLAGAEELKRTVEELKRSPLGQRFLGNGKPSANGSGHK